MAIRLCPNPARYTLLAFKSGVMGALAAPARSCPWPWMVSGRSKDRHASHVAALATLTILPCFSEIPSARRGVHYRLEEDSGRIHLITRQMMGTKRTTLKILLANMDPLPLRGIGILE